MKKNAWVFVFIITVLLIIVGTTVIRNGGITGQVIEEGEDVVINGEKIVGTPEAPRIEEIAPVTKEVRIVNFAYIPSTIEINAGDTVVWENRDTVGHTVTSKDLDEINSRLLVKGERYSHTFSSAGEFPYYCKPHPYMTGKVIVK